MKLAIIVVSYNTSDLTIQTLDSVVADLSHDPELFKQTEIWVVDNNSQDTSVADIKKWQQKQQISLTLIENQDNVGFARANNQAIKKTQAELILLLNSDTIVQKGTLSEMVSRFKPIDNTTSALESSGDKIDRLGILAARLLNPDKSHQPQGGSFPNLMTLFFQMTMMDDLPFIGKFLPSTQHTGKSDREKNAQGLTVRNWVGGTAMMLRSEMLDQIGLLDDNIFMYGEDMEICLRAKHHLWDIAVDHAAKVIHLGSQSGSSDNAVKGELTAYSYIWGKHMPIWQLSIARLIIKLGMILRIILFTILNSQKKKKLYLKLFNEI